MTSTDLIPIPLTGEALDLSAPDSDLAQAFDRIRDLERQLAEARSIVGEELIRRMDSSARWTLHAGELKVTAPSPQQKEEWNVPALKATLDDLLSEGSIGEDAYDAALELTVVHKPRTAGLNALRKLNSDVEERVNSCRTLTDPVRRLSVKRV